MKVISFLASFALCSTSKILNIQDKTDFEQNDLSGEDWTIFKTDPEADDSLRIANKAEKLCDPDVRQLRGYLDVKKNHEKSHYFWWLFESRNDAATDPIILWLNGGPGCSSFTGLLLELGPCKVNKKASDTFINPYSWTSNATVIFLDQPIGTGFSYGNLRVKSSAEAAEGVYQFLRLLFEYFPQYKDLDFHVFGESYAGHYIPEIAKVLTSHPQKVNLKSIGIGNGLVDMLIQSEYYADMAADPKYGPILTKKEIAKMKRNFPKCKRLIEKCYAKNNRKDCVKAGHYCDDINFDAFLDYDISFYDIRKKFDYYDVHDLRIQVYLNRKDVQAKLGVHRFFEGCNDDVFDRFDHYGDGTRPVMGDFAPLLNKGIKVLIYAGDADWICNWIGNKKWVLELDWYGKKEFKRAIDEPWFGSNGKQAGEIRTFSNLTFVRVFKAGHFVPFDQPENSLEMLNKWIH